MRGNLKANIFFFNLKFIKEAVLKLIYFFNIIILLWYFYNFEKAILKPIF